MSEKGHIEALEQRHKDIDRRIVELGQSHNADQLEISELKRKKLGIKDELERYRSGD